MLNYGSEQNDPPPVIQEIISQEKEKLINDINLMNFSNVMVFSP